MIDERYLYEIHPHRPIKNLIPGRAIIKPCSMKLTKSEVLTCMQGGPVFRLFYGKKAIRVVGSNLDQLHVAKYEEYEKLTNASNQTKNEEIDTRATEGIVEEPKTEAPTTPIVEEKPVEPKTENIPEDLQKFVNAEIDLYQNNGEIVESTITHKTAFVSVDAKFPANSSLEDVKRIKADAEKELKEKVEEKRKELDIPDHIIEEEIVKETAEKVSEEEEEVVEETSEPLEDTTVEDVVGVGAPQSANNSVSVNVGNHKNNQYHKKNRH